MKYTNWTWISLRYKNYSRLYGLSLQATSNRSGSRYVELMPRGEDILVSRGNRAQFVKCFVQHALHGSVATQIGQYIQGLQTCFHKAALQMCSAGEVGLRSVFF